MASGPKLSLYELRVVELKSELEKRSIDNMGVKAVLVKRLHEAMIKEGKDPDTFKFGPSGKATPVKRASKSESAKQDSDQDKVVSEDQSMENEDASETNSPENKIDKESSSVKVKKEDTQKTPRKSNNQKVSSISGDESKKAEQKIIEKCEEKQSTQSTESNKEKEGSPGNEIGNAIRKESENSPNQKKSSPKVEVKTTRSSPRVKEAAKKETPKKAEAPFEARVVQAKELDEMEDMEEDESDLVRLEDEGSGSKEDDSVRNMEEDACSKEECDELKMDKNISEDNEAIDEKDKAADEIITDVEESNPLEEENEVSEDKELLERESTADNDDKDEDDNVTVDETEVGDEVEEFADGSETVEESGLTENDAVKSDSFADENLVVIDVDENIDEVTTNFEEDEAISEESKTVVNEAAVGDSISKVKYFQIDTLDEELPNMDEPDFDALIDSECEEQSSDRPEQHSDTPDASLDSAEQEDVLNGIDQIEDSINLNIAEEDTKIIEEAASLKKKDASGERKSVEQGKKAADSRKGDKQNCSPGKTGSDADGKHRNLWVCNLSSSTRATDLKYIFSKHGKVIAAKIVTNAKTPGARCYGYVTMNSPEDAAACAKALHVTELHGKLISIELVASKPGSTNKAEERSKLPEKRTSSHDRIEDKKKKEETSSKNDGSGSDEKRRELREDRRRPEITGPSRSRSNSSREHRSPFRGALSFEHIREQRDRQRLYENHRRFRELEKIRSEERFRQREVERRHKEEALRLEREREKLAKERERIDREKTELLRLERECIEREKEDLRRQQMKLEEARRLKRAAASDFSSPPWKRPAVESSSRAHYNRSRSPPSRSLSDFKRELLRGGRETDRSDKLIKDNRRRDDIPPPRSLKDRIIDHSRDRRDDRRDDHHSKDKRISSHHYRFEQSAASSKSDRPSDSYRKSSPGYSSAKPSYNSSSKVSGYRDASGNWVPTKSLPPWRSTSSSSSSTVERWPPAGSYNIPITPTVGGITIPRPVTYISTSDRFDAYNTLPNNNSRKF